MRQKGVCANRESNPALKLGKLQCYRYTIGAGTQKHAKCKDIVSPNPRRGKTWFGGAGFRSLCLPIANRPLYRVSYTPASAQRQAIPKR
jgi:hypothetical protein